MVKAILIVVVVGLGAFLAYVATRPDTFRVQRVASIKAPPEKIYPMINDLAAWKTWSPYEKKDPAMQRKLSGPPSGKGAIYEWQGNKDVGKGRMEILEAQPSSKVLFKLDFFEPFEGHNTAEFTLAPKGETTDVTWAIYGPAPFITKLMSVIIDMDKMIGRDFDEGLATLKAAVER